MCSLCYSLKGWVWGSADSYTKFYLLFLIWVISSFTHLHLVGKCINGHKSISSVTLRDVGSVLISTGIQTERIKPLVWIFHMRQLKLGVKWLGQSHTMGYLSFQDSKAKLLALRLSDSITRSSCYYKVISWGKSKFTCNIYSMILFLPSRASLNKLFSPYPLLPTQSLLWMYSLGSEVALFPKEIFPTKNF